MRILIGLALVASLASCGGKTDESTATCPKPGFSSPGVLATDQLVFDSDRAGGTHEIYRMNTDGTCPVRLTTNAAYENWWPRVSPDRKKVLFYRSPAGKPEDYAEASLWVMNSDGSAATQLRAKGEDGWLMQGHGEWSPDGSKIAMFGSVGTALEIFVTDANGRHPVQYTNRGGVNTDVSWSPDGGKLLFNGCPSSTNCVPASYEIYVMSATALSPATRLTTDTLAGYDAYFSPDGSRIAWLVNVDPTANPIPGTTINLGRWAIRVANADGSNASYLIDDGNINSKPAWSLDGQTIFFHRMVPPDFRFRVFSIHPNGTGLTELSLGAGGNSEHPSN